MQQEPLTINIPLSKSTPLLCEECNNDTFTQVLYVRTISRFLIGSPEDVTRVIPTFACTKCNHINKDLSIQKLIQDDGEGANN